MGGGENNWYLLNYRLLEARVGTHESLSGRARFGWRKCGTKGIYNVLTKGRETKNQSTINATNVPKGMAADDCSIHSNYLAEKYVTVSMVNEREGENIQPLPCSWQKRWQIRHQEVRWRSILRWLAIVHLPSSTIGIRMAELEGDNLSHRTKDYKPCTNELRCSQLGCQDRPTTQPWPSLILLEWLK